MFDEREAALVDSDHARKCFEDLGIIDRYQSPDKIIAALPTLRASITTTSTLKDRMDMLLSLEYRAARNFYYSPKYRWLFTARQRAHDSAVDKTAAAICNHNPNIIACFGNGCSNLSGIRGRGSRLPVMVCVCVVSFPVRANSPFPSQEIREAVERYSREFYLIDEFNTSKVCVLVCLCRRIYVAHCVTLSDGSLLSLWYGMDCPQALSECHQSWWCSPTLVSPPSALPCLWRSETRRCVQTPLQLFPDSRLELCHQ